MDLTYKQLKLYDLRDNFFCWIRILVVIYAIKKFKIILFF